MDAQVSDIALNIMRSEMVALFLLSGKIDSIYISMADVFAC